MAGAHVSVNNSEGILSSTKIFDKLSKRTEEKQPIKT